LYFPSLAFSRKVIPHIFLQLLKYLYEELHVHSLRPTFYFLDLGVYIYSRALHLPIQHFIWWWSKVTKIFFILGSIKNANIYILLFQPLSNWHFWWCALFYPDWHTWCFLNCYYYYLTTSGLSSNESYWSRLVFSQCCCIKRII